MEKYFNSCRSKIILTSFIACGFVSVAFSSCKPEKKNSDSRVSEVEIKKTVVDVALIAQPYLEALSIVVDKGGVNPNPDNASASCDEKGRPLGESDVSGKWAGKFVYCSLKTATGAFNTIRGSVGIIAGLLCAIDTLPIDNKKHAQNIVVDERCFSLPFVEWVKKTAKKSEIKMTSVAYKSLPKEYAATKYKQLITLKSAVKEFPFDFQILHSGDSESNSLAVYGGFGDANIARHSFRAALAKKKVYELRYEQRSFDNKSSLLALHYRMLITGPTKGAAFKSVGSVQFAGVDMQEGHGAQFISLFGNEADGFQGVNQKAADNEFQYKSYTTAEAGVECYGKSECNGAKALQISGDEDVHFIATLFPKEKSYLPIYDSFKMNGSLNFKQVKLLAEQE